MYFGREHLPRGRWQLGDQSKPAPDIACTLPDESLMEHPTRRGNPQQITIGIENTLDCLLAIAALKTLLDQYNLTAQ
jgi:hypothetical protein